MGAYNTYGGVQIKAGYKRGTTPWYYGVGAKAPRLRDGIYIGREGAIVIKEGKFVMEVAGVFDKWGNRLDCNSLLGEGPILYEIKPDKSQ